MLSHLRDQRVKDFEEFQKLKCLFCCKFRILGILETEIINLFTFLANCY